MDIFTEATLLFGATALLAWGTWVTRKVMKSADKDCLIRVDEKLSNIMEFWGIPVRKKITDQ